MAIASENPKLSEAMQEFLEQYHDEMSIEEIELLWEELQETIQRESESAEPIDTESLKKICKGKPCGVIYLKNRSENIE